MEYGERYCAYVDILGFQQLIQKLDDGERSHYFLRDLLGRVHDPGPELGISIPESEFKVQSISDAVALSASASNHGLAALTLAISRLAIDLLYQGYFIRGAIVKDRLYHDDRMIFGKALIRAYQLEQQVVVYPRVMVEREIVEEIDYRDLEQEGGWIRRSDDGPYFVNVLGPIFREIERTRAASLGRTVRAADSDRLTKYASISEQLQRRFDEATDTPKHFAKVKWFSTFWNECVAAWDIEGFKKVDGPGLPTMFRHL